MVDGKMMDLSKEDSGSLRAKRRDAEGYLKRVNSLDLGTYELKNAYDFPGKIELIPQGADPEKVKMMTLAPIERYANHGDMVDQLETQFKEARQKEGTDKGFVQVAPEKAATV